ncbi:arsenite methyltransferase [Alternaria panax]|uniref:Arsenite methyltransferase n=1 Tax=Alternaria panax TaxID=48097 RepID=A0AAD4IGN5_9PLEO|nr:arsenite methyltransferase [Alternaria panax]
MDSTYSTIHARYTATALSVPPNKNNTSTVARAFGYTEANLSSIPTDSNIGLSCGNPLALANLKRGETVIDLGCGAGLDVFLAAKRVGETGRVVGVDMNEHMLHKARLNAEKACIRNVSFLHCLISDIPQLTNATADVMISNCVINLVPDGSKHLVFREIYRLLKPGGRVAISDILLKKDLPEALKNNVALLVGCVAGASKKGEYEGWLREAGFEEVIVVEAGGDLNVYKGGVEPSSCCGGDGGVAEDMKRELQDIDLNEWAASFKIYAVKP